MANLLGEIDPGSPGTILMPKLAATAGTAPKRYLILPEGAAYEAHDMPPTKWATCQVE